jgi:hypothetical protein
MGFLKPEVQAFQAGADLSALQYTLVKFGASNDLVVGCGAADDALGVLMNAPLSGEVAEVVIAGGAKVKVASTVTLGASVAAGASGVGVNGATTNKCIGKFMDAGVSGDIVPILIDRHVLP